MNVSQWVLDIKLLAAGYFQFFTMKIFKSSESTRKGVWCWGNITTEHPEPLESEGEHVHDRKNQSGEIFEKKVVEKDIYFDRVIGR